MTDTTTQRVSTERARELVGAATPGPWRISDPDGIAPRVSCLDFPICWVAGDTDGRPWIDEFEPGPGPLADAALIAAAPDLAADLIAARERIAALEAERDALEAERDALRGWLTGLADSIERHNTNVMDDAVCNQMLADRLSYAATGDPDEDADSIVDGLRAVAAVEPNNSRPAFVDDLTTCADCGKRSTGWKDADDGRAVGACDDHAAPARHVGPERAAALADGVGGGE